MKFQNHYPTMYDHNQRLTDEAGGPLNHEVLTALQPIFKKFVENGYQPREISHIAQGAVFELEMEAVLNLPTVDAPKTESPKLKLAVDVTVSNKACRFLSTKGFKIAVKAEPSEPDSSWLERAKEADCDMVISDDRQVQFDAAEMGMMTIAADDPGSRGLHLLSAIQAAFDAIPSPPFPSETTSSESVRTEV